MNGLLNTFLDQGLQLINSPSIDPTFSYVNTLDLGPQLYDALHFNKSAKLELGRRLADAWLAIGERLSKGR